jgi:hypothetical protein
MKTYHVTFIEPGELVSTGKRYEAKDEIQALEMFRVEHPNDVFLYIASEEMFNYKY